MVDFIICDDSRKIINDVVNVIDKYMISNNIQYRTHKFFDYDDKFMQLIDEPLNHKIYILDIETPTSSGIDVARVIRNKDKNSVLIFLTGHDELGLVVLKSCLNFLTFISKFDDYELRLAEALDEALALVYSKKSLSFIEHGTRYNIPISNILYITRDTIERKTVIVTDSNEHKVYMPIEKVNELSDNHFIKAHKSCFVNMDRVDKIDGNRNLITFDNGTITDLLSNKYKKEVIKNGRK